MEVVSEKYSHIPSVVKILFLMIAGPRTNWTDWFIFGTHCLWGDKVFVWRDGDRYDFNCM